MSDRLNKGEFEFFMPVQALDVSKADAGGKRWVQGIASTGDVDLQGEIVSQHGIDYDYFLKNGYINDDHKSGPEHKVGEPVEAKLTAKGLWIKGFLYKGKERADYWWEHLTALSTNDSDRKVGFSIQGKILRRNGKKIVKCWLQDVAITACPVNTNTWAEIVKSLNKETWTDIDQEAEEKALTSGSGMALMPESLEGKQKVTTFKSLRPVLTYEEAVEYVQKSRGYNEITARAVVDFIFAANGIQ